MLSLCTGPNFAPIFLKIFFKIMPYIPKRNLTKQVTMVNRESEIIPSPLPSPNFYVSDATFDLG